MIIFIIPVQFINVFSQVLIHPWEHFYLFYGLTPYD